MKKAILFLFSLATLTAVAQETEYSAPQPEMVNPDTIQRPIILKVRHYCFMYEISDDAFKAQPEVASLFNQVADYLKGKDSTCLNDLLKTVNPVSLYRKTFLMLGSRRESIAAKYNAEMKLALQQQYGDDPYIMSAIGPYMLKTEKDLQALVANGFERIKTIK